MFRKKLLTLLLCIGLCMSSWAQCYSISSYFKNLFNGLNKETISFVSGSLLVAGAVFYHVWITNKAKQDKIKLNAKASACSKEMQKNCALSTDIQKILDSHALELKEFSNKCKSKPNARMGCNVCQKDWLPGYYIKYGISRVSNAQRLRAIIKAHNLDLLSVPEKYLYHLPDTPVQLSDENYLVIVKAVDGKNGQGQCLNVKQAKQLCQVALHAKHYDLHPANYVKQENGTLVIIDTDSHAMPSEQEVKRREEDWLLHGTRIHDGGGACIEPEDINDPLIKLELPLYSKHRNYDDQAYGHIAKEVKIREELRLGRLGS